MRTAFSIFGDSSLFFVYENSGFEELARVGPINVTLVLPTIQTVSFENNQIVVAFVNALRANDWIGLYRPG